MTKTVVLAVREYDFEMSFSGIPHPVFNPPPKDAKLWRYMDIPKYLNLLSTETIWFPRSDQLGDAFEGSTTVKTKEDFGSTMRTAFLEDDKKDLEDRLIKQDKTGLVDKMIKTETDLLIYNLFHTYINSWHLNEYESAAMWQLYRRDYGIAVIATMKRMDENLHWQKEIFIGKVRYIDYQKETIPGNNFLWPFMHKRKSFEHEKEVRLLFFTWL